MKKSWKYLVRKLKHLLDFKCFFIWIISEWKRFRVKQEELNKFQKAEYAIEIFHQEVFEKWWLTMVLKKMLKNI